MLYTKNIFSSDFFMPLHGLHCSKLRPLMAMKDNKKVDNAVNDTIEFNYTFSQLNTDGMISIIAKTPLHQRRV